MTGRGIISFIIENFNENSPHETVLNFLKVCSCCNQTILVEINQWNELFVQSLRY